jgi:hypothetical protein
MLRWVPAFSTRETAFMHLDVLIPDELKYGLHSLLVRHGRGCEKCAANGVTSMDFVDRCPINGLVTRSLGGVSPKKPKATGKGTGKGKGKAKDEDFDEDELAEGEGVGASQVKTTTRTPIQKHNFAVVIPPSPRRTTRSRIIKEELSDDKVVQELAAEVQESVASTSTAPKVAVGGLMHGLEV